MINESDTLGIMKSYFDIKITGNKTGSLDAGKIVCLFLCLPNIIHESTCKVADAFL